MSRPQRQWNEDEVVRRLEAVETIDTPEPPADLLEQIQAEIPEDLFPPEREVWIRPQRPHPLRRWLAAAAVAAVAVTGGWLALRVQEQAPPSPDFALPEQQAAAPEAAPSVTESVVTEPPVTEAQEGTPTASPVDAGSPGERAGRKDQGLVQPRFAPPPREEKAEAESMGSLAADGDQYAMAPQMVPIPDPTPAEPEALLDDAALKRDSKERRVEADLRQRQFRVPPAASAAPPPPPAARRVPAPSQAIPKPRAQAGQANEEYRRVDELQMQIPESPMRVAPQGPTVGSTGGTAEPNDQPYGDVFFESAGTNPFIDTEDDDKSTFGFDVDTGSYTVVRRFLNDGHLPPHDAVRVEELVNYFNYRDAPPRRGDFALYAEGAPSPFAQGERYHLLRFAARGRVVEAANRKPALLTFVVDVSGSMAQENRLGLVKRSLGLLLDQLRGDDQVALVVFGSQGRVLLPPTSDKFAIREAIDALQSEGATNAEEGLILGYDIASRNAREGILNRVILCSDGVANVGRTGPDSILARIKRETGRGVELTTLGFGMGNYNDVLMERLADQGNGRYAYIDTLDEARRILVEELTGTLQTIASEARAQVVFNPKVVQRYRLIGYENRDIADHRFRDDTVDAGEIGAGHSVTALYEVKLAEGYEPGDHRAEVATLYVRYHSQESGRFEEIDHQVTLGDFNGRWERSSPALRLTSLVAEFGEILKGSYWAREGSLDEVFRRTQALSGEFAGDREVADLVALMGRAAALEPQRKLDRNRGE